MKRATVLLVLVVLLLLISLVLGWVQVIVLAQSGEGYRISWWTVDGGGHTFSIGGDYSLGSTIGQPDAGPALTNGDYVLVSGFWGGAAAAEAEEEYRIYLPLILRNSS